MIRNDDGLYSTNYDALVEDLETLGAWFNEEEYTDDVAEWPGLHEVVIWYRGGPAHRGELWPDERRWTDAEIDNFIKLIKSGHNMLLVSQNHGYNSAVHYGTGWGDCYGWDENRIHGAIGPGDERLLWALGMTEAGGLDFGGVGRLMSSPRHLPASGTVYGRFSRENSDADGLASAERNLVNSSGDLPELITFGKAVQMVGYGAFTPGQRDCFAPGFVAGVNHYEPYHGGWDVAFFSGGCQFSPYEDVGLFEDGHDFSNRGERRLWWIGYPWATTEVLESAHGWMTGPDNRYMLLHNILGWVDRGLWLYSDTPGSNGPYSSTSPYNGQPEIVQVSLSTWEPGIVNKDSISYTWNGSAGNYPDQTMPDAYVSTAPEEGNYVVTSSRNNDWKNGNDIDFSFPWYAYIVDANGDGIQTGAGNNVDDTVTFGGLLLEDPSGAWQRSEIADPPLHLSHYGSSALYPDFRVPSVVIDGFEPPVQVAGYYISTSGDLGGEVRANYGSAPASFAFDNSLELNAECIAHWPVNFRLGGCMAPGGTDIPYREPQLYWSMYPGQGMLIPGVYRNGGPSTIGGGAQGWDSYRWMFDVDPAVADPVRAMDPYWNRPQFNLTSIYEKGRVVSFDYRTVPGWNPDINRDGDDNSAGVDDTADKFPVRVRLFTEHSDYLNWDEPWPNHLPDPGIDPALGGPVWWEDWSGQVPVEKDWPDFIEGGAFVVDTGSPVYD